MSISPIKLAAYISIALVIMSAVSHLRAQAPAAPFEQLRLGSSLNHDVRMGVTRRFSVEVKGGQYLRINVWNSAAHVAVNLTDASGRKIFSSRTAQWFGDWFISVLHKSESDETLFFEVVPIEVRAGTAKAVVHLIELRPSVGEDQARIEALRVFNEGLSKRSGPVENMRAAQGLFMKASQDFLSAGEYTLSAVSLVNLGWVLQELGDHRNSQQFFKLAISLFSNLSDPLGESKAHAGISYSLNATGDYKGAVAAEERALKAKQVFGIAYEDATSYINIGLNQYLARDNRKSAESCRKGLELSRRALSLDRTRRALSCLSTALTELGEYDEALTHLSEARKISKETGDLRGEAETFLSIAMVQATRGDFTSALVAYEESLSAFRKLGDRSWEANVLKGMASLYAALNSYQRAIETLERSLAINRELGNKKEIVRGLDSLALYNASLGRYAEAEAMYQQVLSEHTASGDIVGQMDALASLGYVFSAQNDFDKAVRYYDRAIALIPKVPDPKAEVRVLAGAAWVLIRTVQRPLVLKGKGYFERAVSREQASGPTATLPILRLGIGFASLLLKDEAGARAAFEASADSARASGNGLAEAWATSYLGILSSSQGRTEESILYGKKAVNILQKIRGEVRATDETLVKGFLSDKVSIYRSLSDRLISVGRLAEAQAVLDLLKDEEYAGVTRAGDKSLTVPYSLSEEKAVKAVENLASLGRRRLELEKLQNAADGLTADLQKELDTVYDEIEKANEAFRAALAALKEAQPGVKDKIAEIEGQQNLTAALEDLQRETGEGAAAVYTVIGTEETGPAGEGKSKFGWVVLVTPKESKAYAMDVEGIEEDVFNFREALSSPAYDPEPFARKIHDRVFRHKPAGQKTTLEDDLRKLFDGDKAPTLMWSLDGVLRYVPTAALHDGEKYLVERYRHVTFNRQSLTSIGRSERRLSVLGLGVSEAKSAGGVNFAALPGAEKELKDLVKASPEETGIVAGTRRLNAEFTKDEAIRLLQRGQHPVVHISSHFSFNPAKQEDSFLLVGDGALYFNDIRNRQGLFNSVDLLALSACDTGMSANGKESESFAYLAQSLGAKTVLASLWKVSDAGTPELMMRFYRLRTRNPQMPKGEAFRLAQLSMLTEKPDSTGVGGGRRSDGLDEGKGSSLTPYDPTGKPRYAHPFYWSAFTLIGNWK